MKIRSLIHGGSQERKRCAGTENVPAIVGLGIAAEEIYTDFEAKIDALYALKSYFIEQVTKISGITVNGKTDRESAPHIVSVSIDGVRAEVMLHTLEDKNIFVSSGSACSSNKQSVSSTLKSIGVENKLLDSTVRFSFAVDTTKEEVDYALEIMNDVIPKLQKYTRR